MLATDRKTKTLVKGQSFDVVLASPDEIRPYHTVYFLDTATGEELIGIHEIELFEIGSELINAWAEIYQPDCFATA